MGINFKILFFLILFLGFLATGIAQQVITTTTTTVLTIPGTTYVTTLLGGENTVTIIMPKYTMIVVEKHPDQACTIVLKPLKTEGVIIIPATTVTIPGTTVQTVFAEPTMKYSTTYEEDGTTTTTGYTYIEFVTTIAGQTFSMPLPLYAEIIERCQTIQIIQEATIIMASVPATFYYAYQGTTYTFEGTTITVKDMIEEIPITTITTTTITPGTTHTETTVFPGTTIVTAISLPTTISTVTEPQKIITSTITYVTTIVKSTPKTTPTTPTPTTITQTTPTTVTTTTIPTSPTTPTKTETTRPGIEFAGLPLDILVGIIAAIAIIIIVVAVLLFREKRRQNKVRQH